MNHTYILRCIVPLLKEQHHFLSLKSGEAKESLYKDICIKKMFKSYRPILEDEKSEQDISTIVDLPLYLPPQINDFDHQFFASKTTKQKVQRSWGVNGMILRRNFIDNRIKSLQYEANDPCEDTLICEQLKSINAYTISIFDGHGGNELSQFSKEKMTSYIDSFINDNRQNENYLKQGGLERLFKDSLKWSYQQIEDSFFEIYEAQVKFGNKKIRNVGTCGITAIVHDDKVFLGNSGDSQAIFIVEDKNQFSFIKGNERLSVNSKSERERLHRQFDEVDENIIVEEYKNCFYLKGRLQPTRTLGDYYLKKEKYYLGEDNFQGPYLSCEPDVNVHKLTNSHRYMVIASDGIWDCLKKAEVVQSLMGKEVDLSKPIYGSSISDEQPFISQLLSQALKRSAQMSNRTVEQIKNMPKGVRRDYHDDISIAIINLGNQIQ